MKDLISIVGIEKYKELIAELGGQRIYIPKAFLTVEDVKIDHYVMGLSVREIAAKYEVSRQTVYNKLGGKEDDKAKA